MLRGEENYLFYVNATLPGGDDEIRTRDLLLAKQALSQLSYTPTTEKGTTFPLSGRTWWA